jgi:RND family efflux transporter MFP subunit
LSAQLAPQPGFWLGGALPAELELELAAWKQFLIALVILGAAAVAWAAWFPGAPEILARWGIEWANAATPRPAAGETAGGSGRRAGSGRVPTAVVTAPVAIATINQRLQAIGTGRANASVTINPYDSGRIIEVAVTAGSSVEKGDVVARLDAEAEKIALDRARLAADDARSKLDRANSLRKSNAGTPVQVADAEMVLGNAELALRDAELALERRSIVAPIAGIVGILPVELGNYVTSQTAIATIDDRSSIIIDFWVPERYASAIAVGAPLTATPIARPSDVFEGRVSAVDNRVDEASRTLRVQARIGNADDSLRAGMSFQVDMRLPGDTYPSVDPLAIQWGTEGSFVWSVHDGKARRTPVRIIQRNTENVLVDGELAEAAHVVIEGIHAVREGAELLIAGGTPARAGAPGVVGQSGS